MSDPIIKAWKPHGGISLWRYRTPARGHEGWHLAADLQGCGSLLLLIELLQHARFSARATFALTPPPQRVLSVPNRNTHDAVPATSWTLSYSGPNANSQGWDLTTSGSSVNLGFGRDYVPELRRAIVNVSIGHGDYSIGRDEDDEQRLWLWWWPGA